MADATALPTGRGRFAGETASSSADRWLQLWAAGLVVLTLLYLLIGTTPYQHEPTLDPDTGALQMSPINRLAWLGLMALALPVLWFRWAQVMALARRAWPLLLLFAWFAATTLWAIDPDASRRRLFLYVINLMICLAVSGTLRDGRQLHAAMATACAVMTLIDLVSWIAFPGASMTDLGLAGIHPHKNTQGSVALFSAFTCASFALGQASARARAFWWAVALGAAAVLVASRSKTSLGILAAVAAATPVFAAVLRARLGLMISWIALALTAVAAALFGWMAWNYSRGLDPFAVIGQITFTQRTDVWRFVLDQARLRPWTGLGFGSFWDIDPKVQPSLQTDYWFAQPDAFTNEAHNGYLDLLVTTGLIGLAGAAAVLARWGLKALAMMRRGLIDGADRGQTAYAGFLAVFSVVVLCHNFLESSYFTANALFGVLILFVGVEVEQRWPPRAAPAAP